MSENINNDTPVFNGDPKDLTGSHILRTLGEDALNQVGKEPLAQQRGDKMTFPAADNKGAALQAALSLASQARSALEQKGKEKPNEPPIEITE